MMTQHNNFCYNEDRITTLETKATHRQNELNEFKKKNRQTGQQPRQTMCKCRRSHQCPINLKMGIGNQHSIIRRNLWIFNHRINQTTINFS